MIRHIWVFYIVGFDGERQNRLLYAPMRTIIQEVRNQYINLGKFLTKSFKWVFHFPSVSDFISFRGFIVSFVVLSLAAGLANIAFRLGRRWLSWLRGQSRDATSLSAGVLSYRRLVQVLATYDLKRNPAETQSEFARQVPTKFLIGQGPANPAGRRRSPASRRRVLSGPVSGTFEPSPLFPTSLISGLTPSNPA